jgi:2-polyprenyl-6-methoxyphenol hydroxylase-like FAD-dependent oxidoreductase
VPVLIVGGGPVGLALATDLGRRGISCQVVERSLEVGQLPKMNHLNARSMELCRRWQIDDQVRGCGWPDDYPMDVAYVTSLAGFEIARLGFPSHRDRALDPAIPEPSQRCPQIWFEPLLEENLAGMPQVRVSRGQELRGFRDAGDCVRAQLRDLENGENYEVEADYLVGADGAGSSVRQIAGIERESWGPAPHQMAIALRTQQFYSIHDKRRAAFFVVLDELGVRSFITPTDGQELWRFNWNLRPGESIEDFDPDEAVRTLAGCEFEYEILGSFAWQVRFTLAEQFRRGRVFLVGDSAHTLAPTGGLGLNTGLADAADLSWKLAGRIAGWGGETLLDSYEAERLAAARAIMDESLRNLARLVTIPRIPDIEARGPEADARRDAARRTLEEGDYRLEWENEGAALGGRYADSPIVVPDAGEPPPYDPNQYRPTSHPGCRAPHAQLPGGGSMLDLYDAEFVLLQLGDEAVDTDAISRAAVAAGLPLRVERIEDPSIAALYERALVLVRPDGYVAWRGDALPEDPKALIDRVRGR